MGDKIGLMVNVLSKAGMHHKIEHDLREILGKLGIFKGRPRMEFEVHHRWSPSCFVSCTVPAENNIFGKRIDISIKPDHSEHRVLRVLVQEDANIETKAEDMDKPNLSDKKVFQKEIHALEKDIEKALNSLKKRELKEVA